MNTQAHRTLGAIVQQTDQLATARKNDLRFGDREAWNLVVREGTLKNNGMVSFAENLDAEEAEAIRAYVIRRANEPVLPSEGE